MKKRSELAPEPQNAIEKKIEGFLSHSRFDRFKIDPKHPRVRDDMERVVETLFRLDVQKEHRRLLDALVIDGPDIGDKATIKMHLNHSTENRMAAHSLYCVAIIEQKKWLAEQEKVKGAIWDEATTALQIEKDAGGRNKAIQNADVTAKAAEKHPDEWAYIQTRTALIEQAVSHFKELHECWVDRCATLRALLNE